MKGFPYGRPRMRAQPAPLSTIEAITIRQAEYKNLVENPRRPNLKAGEPNLDFVIDGSKP